MPSLQQEIRRTLPFEILEEEAVLNIIRTADFLSQANTEILKPFHITNTQYNVLRILRGAGATGLPASEIASRLVTRDPDVTRLLDRLKAARYVVRRRGKTDRRVVTAHITPEGMRILEQLDHPVTERLQSQLGHLGPRKLRLLIRLLESCRTIS